MDQAQGLGDFLYEGGYLSSIFSKGRPLAKGEVHNGIIEILESEKENFPQGQEISLLDRGDAIDYLVNQGVLVEDRGNYTFSS